MTLSSPPPNPKATPPPPPLRDDSTTLAAVALVKKHTFEKKVIREAWAAEVSPSDAGQGGGWTIRRQIVEYRDGETTLEGLYARPEGDGLSERIPGVIVAHTAVGSQEGAHRLSQLSF